MIQHGRCVIAIAGHAERFFEYFARSDTGQDVASTSPHGGRFSRLQAQGEQQVTLLVELRLPLCRVSANTRVKERDDSECLRV